MDVKSTFIALLCGIAALAAQAGQVYKWVDPNGRVHFSDTPQQGWQPVDLSGASTSDAAPGAPAATEEDAGDAEEEAPASAETAESTETAEGTEADASTRTKLRAEECTRAKEQLDSYKRAPKIVERDALGKEKEYSSEERLQLIEQQQKRVSDYCGT